MVLSLAQLSATVLRNEGLDAWPQLMQLLQCSTRSPCVPEREVRFLEFGRAEEVGGLGPSQGLGQERAQCIGWFFFDIPFPWQMGLLLLSVVVTSRPEAFRPHHRELLCLLNETLVESASPGLLYYSLRTLTTMIPYLGPNALVRKLLFVLHT